MARFRQKFLQSSMQYHLALRTQPWYPSAALSPNTPPSIACTVKIKKKWKGYGKEKKIELVLLFPKTWLPIEKQQMFAHVRNQLMGCILNGSDFHVNTWNSLREEMEHRSVLFIVFQHPVLGCTADRQCSWCFTVILFERTVYSFLTTPGEYGKLFFKTSQTALNNG